MREPQKSMFAVERIFHPVGQGGFYTERIAVDDMSLPSGKRIFNVVYDCGTSSRQLFLDSEIGRSYCDGSIIDLMFISHLDEDHINGMDKFKKKNIEIKCLVLPLLEKSRFWFYFLESGINVYQKNALKSYFNAKSIIFIYPFNGEVTNLQNSYETIEIDVENLPEDEKPRLSGSKIGFRSLPFWSYIPYNFDFDGRYHEFMNILKDVDATLYAEITDKSSDKSKIIGDDSKLKVLRRVYDKLTKRNDSSLMVYSGPLSDSLRLTQRTVRYDNSVVSPSFGIRSLHKSPFQHRKLVGALYTGDIDLNQTVSGKAVLPSLSDHLNRGTALSDMIGTVQIPHHGSVHNYSDDIFSCFPVTPYYFVSYGTTNHYGHPFPGMEFNVMTSRRTYLEVTEQRVTGIKQIIYN